MVEHVSIPNDGLHEPKDIDSASVGQAYIADGLGSGSWATPWFYQNEVIVTQESDFGVASGGVITLADDTAYYIKGSVICANRLQAGTNNTFRGQSGFSSILTYTGTGDFITLSNSNFGVDNVQFNCPSQPSTSFVIKNTAGGDPYSIVINDYRVTNCGSFISSDSTSVLSTLGRVSSVLGKGFEMLGASALAFSLNRTLIGGGDAASELIDLNSVVLGNIELVDCAFIGLGTTLVGVGDANVPAGGVASVRGCSFGSTTPLSGISPQDNRWDFFKNFGVDDSRIAGQGAIEGNATATTFTGTGVSDWVKINFGTSFVPDTGIQDRVSVDNTGAFTYEGETPKALYFSAEMFGEVGGGATREYVFAVAVNGTAVLSSNMKRRFDGSNPGAFSVSSALTLQQNDVVEMYVRAVTATTALTIDTASFKLIGGI